TQYQKFKAKNVRINLKSDESRSKHVLVAARELSLGYDQPLFDGIDIDLREGEALELRGRNGAGKTTLIKYLLAESSRSVTLGGGTKSKVQPEKVLTKSATFPASNGTSEESDRKG